VNRVTLPDVELVPVTLRPRRVLHGHESKSLADRVSLGTPHAVRLRAEGLAEIDSFDAPTATFLREEELDITYYLLSLVVNFYPDEDLPLTSAEIGVLLSHDGPSNLPAPLAHSIAPIELRAPAILSASTTLTANLGLVKAKSTRIISGETQDPFLLGLGEGRSDPEWRFCATETQRGIIGVHRLLAVVRAPSNVNCQASIILAAAVRKRLAGLIHYRAELPPEIASVEFPH